MRLVQVVVFALGLFSVGLAHGGEEVHAVGGDVEVDPLAHAQGGASLHVTCDCVLVTNRVSLEFQ